MRLFLYVPFLLSSTAFADQLPPTSQPMSQPASQPVTSQPVAPRPLGRQAVDEESLARGAGDACRLHSECRRPLFCIDQLCAPAPARRQKIQAPIVEKKSSGGIGKKGTTSVGGNVSFSIDTVVPEHGDSITGFRIDIAPRLSHFVSDNFDIGLTLGVGTRSGDLYEGLPTNVGFGVSFRRLFGSSGTRFYLGVDLGPEFAIPETGDTVTFFVIGPRLGLLVPLNEHVAVDVGFRPSFAISTGSAGTLIRVPFGLGIEAFF